MQLTGANILKDLLWQVAKQTLLLDTFYSRATEMLPVRLTVRLSHGGYFTCDSERQVLEGFEIKTFIDIRAP